MISAVIPTFRGRARLERNLPSVTDSLAASGEAWEVVVVDDGGGGLGPLPSGARLLALERNRGYGPAVNAGVRAARGEHLLVLNDDVRLDQRTVAALRDRLSGAGLFAVVPAIRSPLAACGDEGGKAGMWQAGEIELREITAQTTHPTLYPIGCCFLCRRQDFLDLGGYDELFAPFFWEDVDLGYRAWRRGLATLHVPDAVCDHEGSATLAEAHTLEARERAFSRNRVLFHLRNLRDPSLRAQNMGAWAAHALFDRREALLRGLSEAIDAFARSGPRSDPGLADGEILARAGGR